MERVHLDEYIREQQAKMRDYCLVLLKFTPKSYEIGSESAALVEHAGKNFELHEKGILKIICPVFENPQLRGLYIFDAGIEQVKEIMEADPAVREGIFEYEVYPCRSLPLASPEEEELAE